MSFENTLKRLGHRDWDFLKSVWIEGMPNVVIPVKDPIGVDELPDLQNVISEIQTAELKTTNRDHYFQIEGLQTAVFSEAIILFYKSVNVLSCSLLELNNGYKTWSVAAAYQSSFFSIKCLLNIFGVNIARINNKELLLDLVPSYHGFTKKELARRKTLSECRILIVQQMEHWEVWSLAQRIIRTTSTSLIPAQIFRFICSIDSREFAKQRNNILYYNTQWLFDDLRERVIDADFGNKIVVDNWEYSDDDANSLIIAYILINTTFKLFHSIAEQVPLFKIEFEAMKTFLKHDDCSRYTNFINLNHAIM